MTTQLIPPTLIQSVLAVDQSGTIIVSIPPELELRFADGFLRQLRRLHHLSIEEAVSHDIYRRTLDQALVHPELTVWGNSRRRIVDEINNAFVAQAPIMPPSEMELAAYIEEGTKLQCIDTHMAGWIKTTPGKFYTFTVEDWSFKDMFEREAPCWDDETGFPSVETHHIILKGEERRVSFTDDTGQVWVFTDRKPDHSKQMLSTATLWEMFEPPSVLTVKEMLPGEYQKNWDKLDELTTLSGFSYYPGQQDYIARVACKNFGIAAASTGVGKTLVGISLAYIKGAERIMIIAPKGVIKGKHEGFDYIPSQWEKEIERFCPHWDIHRIYDRQRMEWLLRDHGGELPKGVYVFYPQALFTNGAIESLGPSATEEDVCQWLMVKPHPYDPTYWRRGVGDSNSHGIRCIIKPSLATELGDKFDMVLIDEAHFMQTLDAQLTQGVLRLQAPYRFGLTATPIPDVVSNVFPLAGWLAVPGWYRGMRSVSWPYRTDEFNYFKKSFVSREENITKTDQRRAEGKRGKVITESPIISNPSRMLRALKPIMAYITKEQCNPNLVPKYVTEVRVPFARQQAILYRKYLDQRMIPTAKDENKVVTQQTVLRSICADPHSCHYNDGTVTSDFNAKIYTVLELITQALERGEQIVVVSSRIGITNEIAHRLRTVRIDYSRIDGELNSDLHSTQSDRFKRGASRVLLMGIKLAQGFSFDRCPNLVITSLEWNFKTREQAFGRVWRMNSVLPARIWVVLNENSIEEVMYDKVATKESAALLCLQGKYLPTNYAPVSGAALLANHIIQTTADGFQHLHDESYYESLWPSLASRIRATKTK